MRAFWTILVSAALVVGCNSIKKDKHGDDCGCCGDKKEKAEKDEAKMTLDQTPPAVQAALKREAGAAEIKGVDKEVKDGKTIYETDVMKDGKEWEIRVDEQGNVVSSKAEEGDEKGEKDKD